MKAWLITWEWIGDHAAVDMPLITILSARLGSGSVREFIEQYHITTVASPQEKLESARYSRPERVYPAEEVGRGRITCGHNPFIYGRVVESMELTDRLTWVESGRCKSLPLNDRRQ